MSAEPNPPMRCIIKTVTVVVTAHTPEMNRGTKIELMVPGTAANFLESPCLKEEIGMDKCQRSNSPFSMGKTSCSFPV